MRRLLKAPPRSSASVAALAPMVDVLTILLVFLLRSYSTDPPVRPDDPSFALPVSVSEAPVGLARTLEITDEALYLNGARLASVGYYLDHPGELIQELHGPLASDPSARLRVIADKDTPYQIIRQALATAREAGVRDVSLVAASRAGI